jgi:GNAT superfamily N-acetyltransferase
VRVDIHLRRAADTDAAQVAKVYVASWNAGFDDLMPSRVMDSAQIERWQQDLTNRAMHWWLAMSGNSAVGFVGTGPSRDPIDAHLGELDTIAVAPTAWRHGVGRRLMTAALDDLVDAGYRDGILWTLADYDPGRRFYEATGWRASGELRDGGMQVAFRRRMTAAVDLGGSRSSG